MYVYIVMAGVVTLCFCMKHILRVLTVMIPAADPWWMPGTSSKDVGAA